MKPTLAEVTDALIAVFEGPPRLKAFKDGGGVWTIARGHTKGVTEGMTCTPEESTAWFAEDEAPLLRMVEGKPLLSAAAHASFGYNCGHGALEAVLRGVDSISNPKHTTDRHGVVEPGLVARRRLEQILIAVAEG